MTQVQASQLINAPIDAVWPWIIDLTKHSQWSPKPYSVELISGMNGEVGSKYRSTFVFMAHDENGFYKNSFTLESVGQSTQVTYQNVFPQMKGIGRILVPLLVPIFGKKDAMARLGLLKAKAEGK